MPERRFSDDEISTIFQRATASEDRLHPSLSAGDGLTLTQLQEIGRDVGVAPELVAQAARSLDDNSTPETRGVLGLPLRVQKIVNVDRPLSDAEWERLVVDLREIFDARGVTRRDGSLRQWSNGNLQVLLEPTEHAQRVRLKTYKGNAVRLMTVGGGALLVGLVGIGSAIGGGAAVNAGTLLPLAFVGVFGASILVGTAARLPGWARRRREQMEEVAARLTAMSLPR